MQTPMMEYTDYYSKRLGLNARWYACPKCGEECHEEDNTCFSCGYQIPEREEDPDS